MHHDKFRKALPFLVGFVLVLVAGVLPGPFLKPLPMVVAFFAGLFVTKVVLTPRHDPAGVLIADGISKLEFDNTIRDARVKLNALQNEAFRINDAPTRAKVNEINRLVDEVIKDVKTHPEDFRTARQFFNYYLGATVKIVSRYAELATRPDKSPELLQSLAQVEGELETIRGAFEKQLRVLVENDVMDLDIELKVLKRTIEMEGLAPDADQKTGGPAPSGTSGGLL